MIIKRMKRNTKSVKSFSIVPIFTEDKIFWFEKVLKTYNRGIISYEFKATGWILVDVVSLRRIK